MSPLAIVGITLLTTVLADVSHVLQGQAHPPTAADPQEINNAFNAQNAKDFWWMQEDSPLKASYDYFKKCAATGKCATSKHEFKFSSSSSEGTSGPIDVQKNIFLNGNFASAGASSSFSGSSSSSGGSPKTFHNGATLDIGENPFLQVGFAHAANGDRIRNENGFIGVQPSVPFKGLRKTGYQSSVAVSGQGASGLSCAGNDRICVAKQDCVNGVVSNGATDSHKNACDENQVCCQLSSAGKSSLAEHVNQLIFTPGKSKFTGKDGLTPEQVQIIHSSQEGIRPQFNFIGESDGSSTVKPTRDVAAAASDHVFSSTPDYSDVQFGNDARFSNLEGLDYLPPHPSKPPTPRPTQPPSCPPGQYLNNFGRCEPVREPCPPGTRPTPSGGCEKVKIECPPGQRPAPYGGCVPIQPPTLPTRPTPQPPTPPQCPFGQKPGPYGGCEPVQPPTPTPSPQCPPGQRPASYGGCVPIQTPTPPTPQPPTPPQCPFGQKPGPYGGCVPVQPPTPPPTRPPTITTTTTEKPYCPSGQREGPNGECISVTICGPGQKPTPVGGCEPIPTPPPQRPCPPGQKPGPYGGCVSIATPAPPTPRPTSPSTPYCPSGQRVGPNGECVSVTVCGAGQRPTQFGGCEPIRTTTTPSPPTITQCPFGQRPSQYGGCESITTPPTQRTCPPGQKPGPYGGCISVTTPTPPITPPPSPSTPYCPSGQRDGPNGECISVTVCGPGQRPTQFGGCEPIRTSTTPTPPTTPQCPFGQRPSQFGGCESIRPTTTPSPSSPQCPFGQRPTPYGGCEPISTPPPQRPCPPGQKPGPYGSCIPVTTPTSPPPPSSSTPYCPSGQREGPNGECISVTVCGPGQKPTQFGGCETIRPTTTPSPPSPQCPFGQRPTPYGGCEPISTPPPQRPCPPGQKPGPYGGCIPTATPPPPTPQCPFGQRPSKYGGCESVPTPPPQPPIRCGPGQTLGPYGQCIPIQTPPTPTPTPGIYCNAGERVGPNGECIKVPTCPPGQTIGPFGQCTPPSPPTRPPTRPPTPPPTPRTCPPGQQLNPSGVCVFIRTPPPPTPPSPQCPPGQVIGPYGGCVGQPTPRPPPKTCRPGYTLTPNGQCVPVQTVPPPTPRPTPYCSSGQRVGPNGECIDVTPPPQPTCGPGQKLGPYGGCVDIQRPTPPPRPTCPPGSFPTIAGGCQRPSPPPPQPPLPCPPGTVISPSGRCETPPPPPRPITCPPGSYLGPSGNCVRPPTSTTTSRTYLPPKTPTSGAPGHGYPTITSGSNIESEYSPGRPDEISSPGGNVAVKVPGPQKERNYTITDEQIPVGCAAALKCVQEIYCTADGFVSPVPVVLTKEQELLRAPTTVCRDIGSGTLGKCCRDRDYQDAWPSANLVNGVDDGQYAEDDSIGQYKAEYNNRISRSSAPRKTRTKRAAEECGIRNLNSSPQGQVPIDADFAEISWQAMILRDSNRSLLCGGAIIKKNAVLTAAHCVEGLETSDILIKGGEWKLGIDEEPLPFQIVKVAAILRHPDFQVGTLQNDLAVLVLDEHLRFTKNIGQICLPEPNLIPTQNCIATGWGKRILQLHARNALMHKIDVNIMDVQQCQQVMGEHFQKALSNYNTNTLCGFSSIDQCKVDYGSALACADEYGHYTLSGVYSWDTGCKQQGQIGGYVAPDVDWIENVLNTPLRQLKRLDRAYNTARLQREALK